MTCGQEFQLYGNYELPFGHNQHLFSSVPNWAIILWRISGVASELVERSSLQSELWRVRSRYSERPLYAQ